MQITQFQDLSLPTPLLAALTERGYLKPTPIQSEVIPYLLNEDKKDLVALAQTGSGKTAAFGIPLAEKLDSDLDCVQALILSPTRELASQIQDTLKPFLSSVGLRTMTIYGGQSYSDQKDKLRRKPHVIVATPGRLVDLLNQKSLDLSRIRVLVLDEADRMLSMGFEEDLQFILESTHQQAETKNRRASCQTWLFSATMGPGIRRILNRYLTEPKIIEQITENQGVSNTLEHQFLAVKTGFKPYALLQILKTIENFYGIVFCQTKKEVSELEQLLMQNNVACMSLHGDKVQKDRERVLKLLKDEKFQVLIATDVAARGLDVKNLRHVVHYSLPIEIESYVHRSGRTGRNGEEGLVISLLDPTDFARLNRLRRTTGIEMKPFQLIRPEAWLEKQAKAYLERLSSTEPENRHFETLKEICEKALTELDTKLFSTADWMAAFLMEQLSPEGMDSQSYVIKDFKAHGEGRRDSRGSSRSSGGGRERRSTGKSASRGGGGRRYEGRSSEGRGSDSRSADGRSAEGRSYGKGPKDHRGGKKKSFTKGFKKSRR